MEDKGITIERIFDAPIELVWKAWTTPEMIKKWWGPEGFSAPSIKIDLRAGGKYIYAMQGPKGSKWDMVMYSSGVYKEIVPQEKIVSTDFFSDEKGNKVDPKEYGQSADAPDEMTVIVLFEEIDGGKTKLSIIYPLPKNEAQAEAMLKSGMQEGWNSSLNKLAVALEEK